MSDTRLLLALALAKLVFHLATTAGYGVFRDELYYLACAAHPALGYVDHPPLSIWLLWLQTALLGDSLFALRLLPAIAGAASVFVAGRLAREMGGGRAAQVLTAIAVFGAPQLLAISHFYSMNVYDWLLWSLLAWVALRILAGGDQRQWLLFGALAGLTLLNKLQVAVFALGISVGLLLTPQRDAYRRPWIWLGGALAALIFLPHLAWQVAWGWPTLEFIHNAPLWAGGLVALFVAPRLRRFRPLGWAYLVALAIFVAQQAKVYYLTPIYPVLLAAGAVALEHIARERALRWPLPAAISTVTVGALAVLPLAVPVLPVGTLIEALASVGLRQPQTERHERSDLPQIFADMHGWAELVEALALARDSLRPEERDSVTLLASNYGEAGAIDRLGTALGLPGAISGHNSYWFWGHGDYAGGTILSVGFSEEQLGDYFESVEEAGRVRCVYCMPSEGNAKIHVLRGPKRPVEELWDALRRFM
jgi:hypothetical protein